MCYNVNLNFSIGTLEKRFGAGYDNFENYPAFGDARISGFAHPKLPVITSENPAQITLMKWGLVPRWVKDEKRASEMQKMTLNARCETIFTKGTFSAVFKKRCLVLVNGFYEWQHRAKQKLPYFIHLSNQEPFALGGVYDEWTNPETGEISRGLSIVTQPANSLMSEIHNSGKRMPLILSRDNERQWINPALNKAEIGALITPFPSEMMKADPV